MRFSIKTILRAVCLSGVSSAYRSQLPALSVTWQSVQFKLREAEKKPIVPMNSFTGIPRSTWMFLKASSDICGFRSLPALAAWLRAQVVPMRHKIVVPMAQRIARLDLNFILPPSLAVRDERGAVWRSKQIGAGTVSSGPSLGRAYRFEGSLRLVGPADTIRLPASARNGRVPALWS